MMIRTLTLPLLVLGLCSVDAHAGPNEDLMAACKAGDLAAATKALDGGANLHDLGQRLMADHQVVIPGRRGAVLKGTDLFVGAADADIQQAQRDLVGLGEPGNVLLDDLDLLRSGKDRDGFQILSR